MSRFVLVTRQPENCTELQSMLSGGGLTVLPFPVMRLEELVDEPGWAAILGDESSPEWLIMASPRTPSSFARQCRERSADALLDLPLAVVGDGTATACLEAGLRPVVTGPGTGVGLAEILASRWTRPTTAIVACGHHRRPELTDALTAAGHRLLPVAVYRMSATPTTDLPPVGAGIEAVVVTSPRAATLYLNAVGGQPLPCPHWALGPTTREAVRSIGLDCRIPPRPTLESLAEELCQT